jgi:transglutaminase-like putative cysteine protease
VRDFIEFYPSIHVNTPKNTIKLRKGNCLSKAYLLVSLYRAFGMPEEHVRIIVGELLSKEMLIEHAWVEVKCDGTWFQQDAKDNIAFLNLDSLKIEIITIHL